ncbi:hypothetical protein ILYODFUR_039178 [Ilyodon furcidens]|uniref:Secreted protein n=1 Tax=Ilyodon furcidens TaxID=33524 RepID=A0ABV0UE13_9TELE
MNLVLSGSAVGAAGLGLCWRKAIGHGHVFVQCGAVDNILGVCFQAVHGVHLLPHSRSVLSVGPQVSGQSQLPG